MVLERERKNSLVGLVRHDLTQRARDLGVGDLAPRPELGQPAAFARLGEAQRAIQGWSPIMPLISSVPASALTLAASASGSPR